MKTKRLFKLIKENKIEEVLNTLESKNTLKNTAILLSNRFRCLKDEKIRDVITSENYKVEYNKIVESTILLVDRRKKESKTKKKKRKKD